MPSKTSKKIIGITGAFGSGKTTAAEFFRNKGYTVVVLSSLLEKEAEKRNLPLTREILQDIGNEMREKYGKGILLKKALESLPDTKKIVIDGLRNLGEVEELKKQGGILLAIVANREVRFTRLMLLKRRERLTDKLFQMLDLRDMGVNEKITGLQTAFCIALADNYIDSNGTRDAFYEDLKNFLEKYGK
jgi:dephospho-CoA kinase